MIESNNIQQKSRIVTPTEKKVDKHSFSNILRPEQLSDYVGQKNIKKHLSVAIDSSKIRKEPLDHILFYGPPGLGKTTLSVIIANEMGGSLKSTSGPAIEKQSDLVSILSNLQDGDILFIDEIHRIRPQIEEILYTAMEDFCIDVMVGSGTGAQSVKIPLKKFSLIGATTRLSALSNPLRDRFGNILKLDFYEPKELEKIIHCNALKLELELSDFVLENLSKKSRGTPRIANRLLKIIRDYAIIGKDLAKKEVVDEIFADIGIDRLGLDYLDRKYLELIHTNFSGGPVGLNTIASAIGEEEATIEDVVEPYLLQIGFIERTPRGRKITLKGEKHISTK